MSGLGWTDADAANLALLARTLMDATVQLASIAGSLRAEALRPDPDVDEPARDECPWCEVIGEHQAFGETEPTRIRALRAVPDPEGA